ncbi:MAG: class II fumarate hydratase [Candidatus Binatia bacterium]
MAMEQTRVRIEHDSLGPVEVPAERLWGAQTQRALAHFAIGDDRMPIAVIHAYGVIKKAAALVNAEAGRLPHELAELIVRAADELVAGALDDEFPLSVWQSGSGTQTNMNVNEVIANRAIQLRGGRLGSQDPVHPNDHVNLGQSSNDTFPTAMHLAAARALVEHLLPRVTALHDAVAAKATAWADVVKIGRTHLQDAVPLTLGQEWSGYAQQLADGIARVRAALDGLYPLALGGTAVGTGLNAPPGFAEATAARIAALTGLPFVSAPNKFAALAGVEALVHTSGALRTLAGALMKIANDIRWLGSGPRCGLGELILPANEPGSSIMPGKVNPTQCEATIMVCIAVLGADAAIAIAGTQGNFELSTVRPLVIHELLHAARILGDACESLRVHCVVGIEPDRRRIAELLDRSLMLVTALTPVIGYDQASRIAHHALREGLTLREAALRSGLIDAATFDRIVDPRQMV